MNSSSPKSLKGDDPSSKSEKLKELCVGWNSPGCTILYTRAVVAVVVIDRRPLSEIFRPRAHVHLILTLILPHYYIHSKKRILIAFFFVNKKAVRRHETAT